MSLPRCLTLLALIGAAPLCAAAGWPALDTANGVSLLQADQAFQLLPVERKGQTVKLEWSIAPGYFLYRDRIHVDAVTAAGTSVAALDLPPALRYDEAGEGIVDIYRNDVRVTLHASTLATAQHLRVRYQAVPTAACAIRRKPEPST